MVCQSSSHSDSDELRRHHRRLRNREPARIERAAVISRPCQNARDGRLAGPLLKQCGTLVPRNTNVTSTRSIPCRLPDGLVATSIANRLRRFDLERRSWAAVRDGRFNTQRHEATQQTSTWSRAKTSSRAAGPHRANGPFPPEELSFPAYLGVCTPRCEQMSRGAK